MKQKKILSYVTTVNADNKINLNLQHILIHISFLRVYLQKKITQFFTLKRIKNIKILFYTPLEIFHTYIIIYPKNLYTLEIHVKDKIFFFPLLYAI